MAGAGGAAATCGFQMMIVALARRDIIGAVAVVAAVYQRAPEHMAVLVRELPVPRSVP